MCGVAGLIGGGWSESTLASMNQVQHHRGPDAQGVFKSPGGQALLGHRRLSIIDLSEAGRQPMSSPDGRHWMVFNGEIYNYLELRSELRDYAYRSRTDTEVVLAAYQKWGAGCLDRLVGMFAFMLWDEVEHKLFAARDRFGVKPLYFATPGGRLALASEIQALFQAGLPPRPDATSWATYLASGLTDHTQSTFWEGVSALPAGHFLEWQDGRLRVTRWYDVAERAGSDYDHRPLRTVAEEYRALLMESVRLRFRADVPVGINLSGGLDSSALLGLVQAVQGPASEVMAFTFVTGQSQYDELPWVERMLARTRHPSVVCELHAADVPALAASVQTHQLEPFGGLPTLAYARLFEQAQRRGVKVLLDGQGMDEQWAGYDYYASQNGDRLVQGTDGPPLRPACLTPEFRRLASPLRKPDYFPDALRNLQYRDLGRTKLPRALRFNDRVSMRASVELREPFLDHRLVELALRQPPERKIAGGVHKWMLRQITLDLAPSAILEAPKRPVQTPQREWLRGDLSQWADDCIETALSEHGGAWLEPRVVRAEWQKFCEGVGDNSFFVWQWINLGLAIQTSPQLQSAS